mmetsp:Transcript_29903/g.64692  ORF Transcript_29903/g.64692 Transcript_29903/m.64692 type:complete len:134 (+) Transcript_29903:108-509(+)
MPKTEADRVQGKGFETDERRLEAKLHRKRLEVGSGCLLEPGNLEHPFARRKEFSEVSSLPIRSCLAPSGQHAAGSLSDLAGTIGSGGARMKPRPEVLTDYKSMSPPSRVLEPGRMQRRSALCEDASENGTSQL